MRIIHTTISTLFNKCPRCHQEQVFKESNPYVLSKMFQINETCNHCGLKYQKEPSFFYGAMYISYALTSGWFMVWYILYLTLFSQTDTLTFALMLSGSLLILSPLTLRWSRLIWLNIFYKFNKDFITLKQSK